MWVQFVAVFSIAPGGLFTGYFGFPLSTKTTVFKLQFYQKWYMKDRPVDVLALNLFINSVYLFILIIATRDSICSVLNQIHVVNRPSMPLTLTCGRLNPIFHLML